jgi:aminopeptidase N
VAKQETLHLVAALRTTINTIKTPSGNLPEVVIVQLQASNPQVAARIARAFDRWRQFDAGRQAHARAALERVRGQPGLARDVAEVVGNALR